ncbi:RHS repeat-associated core domain-containing protein [Geothermobacter hydrogeniphilus]|uniref:RHS repeat-associated core domain-containing protein n=1 Tax=Geothermobacter hydrogeniphilus TaxID=1969733 RepID=UPI001304CE63|nr:RHS repeat-associated core domain-containing protein [Geothermobacter hydrogeniphilus]
MIDAAGTVMKKTFTGYEVIEKGGRTLKFDKDGKLRVLEDAIGNFLNIRYDAQGRISIVENYAGQAVLTFGYSDDDYRIDSITDIFGRTVQYRYNQLGQLIEVEDWTGRLESYTYNDFHGMLSKTTSPGETYTIEYLYPDRGIVKQVIDPVGTQKLQAGQSAEGHIKSFLYDFKNRQFWIRSPNGYTTQKVFGKSGMLLAEYRLDPENVQVRKVENFDYKEIHYDSAGNATEIYRDDWQNVTKIIDGEGNVSRFTYFARNKPLTIVDPLGVITKFEYDRSSTLLIKKIQAAGLPEETVTEYGYTPFGELATVTVDGATTTIEYNDLGLPTAIVDPLGNRSRLEYDPYGHVAASIDANGNRTEIVNDGHGNPVTIRDPLGHETVLAYNQAGRLQSVTDALLRTSHFETDFKGHVTAIVDALNNRREFVYDGEGNLVEIREKAPGSEAGVPHVDDAVTRLDYDASNRLIAVIDPEGNQTRYEYATAACGTCGGSNRDPAKVIDAFNQATSSQFDKNGRLIGITDPLNQVTSLARDAAGRIVSRTDANGNTTSYRYDPLGRVIEQTDAEGGITSFTYDRRGNLIALTDPENNRTSFEYDLANRKVKETRPLGQTTTYSYYPNGLLKTVRDARGQVTTYSYDAANRLVEVVYQDGSSDSFAYDEVGNLVSYANAVVSGVIGYDDLNRKISETVTIDGIVKDFSYSYDHRGNKKTYTSPEGIVHTYAWLKNNRLAGVSFDGHSVGFGYDKTRLSRITFPNGVTTDYTYNAVGWLESITTSGSGGSLFQRGYSFDKVGNITAMTGNAGSTAYSYDLTYQLTGADHPAGSGLQDESYSYDRVGNRLISAWTSGSWSSNANNELLGYTGNDQVPVNYAYDANGNTVKETRGVVVTEYVYNSRNRLERVHLPDGRVASYFYDPFGRRVKKVVANVTTLYVYADEGLVGEYDSAGMLQKAYGWKPGGLWGTDPLYMRQGGAVYYYHNDHLGTPQRLSDASGNVVWSAGYQAFGLAVIDPASTVENNLRFPGQYFDAETGLHYNWWRYFDPKLGKYYTYDPMGIFAGYNCYTYGYSNPINNFDNFGLNVVTDVISVVPIIGTIQNLIVAGLDLSDGANVSDYVIDVPVMSSEDIVSDYYVDRCKESIKNQALAYQVQAQKMMWVHGGVDVVGMAVVLGVGGAVPALVLAVDGLVDMMATGEIIEDIGEAAIKASKKCENNKKGCRL